MMGKSAMSKQKRILKDKNVTKKKQDKNFRNISFPNIHIWKQKLDHEEEGQKKHDAFELWVWPKILGVSWIEMKAYKEILQKVRPNIS